MNTKRLILSSVFSFGVLLALFLGTGAQPGSRSGSLVWTNDGSAISMSVVPSFGLQLASDVSTNGPTNLNLDVQSRSSPLYENYGEITLTTVADAIGASANIVLDGQATDLTEVRLSLFGSPQHPLLQANGFPGNTNIFLLGNTGKITTPNEIELGIGVLIHSNTIASLPTLASGDVFFWSSHGILYAICKSDAGTATTNKLAP